MNSAVADHFGTGGSAKGFNKKSNVPGAPVVPDGWKDPDGDDVVSGYSGAGSLEGYNKKRYHGHRAK